tara:strand:- start:704 stop:919 length:216 start_codon:yes stop_codon:yes gene_type:complete
MKTVTPIRKTLPFKLKRIELGIRAYDFAASLGISASELSLLENGRKEADWWLKDKSADLLGVSYEELWGDK